MHVIFQHRNSKYALSKVYTLIHFYLIVSKLYFSISLYKTNESEFDLFESCFVRFKKIQATQN